VSTTPVPVRSKQRSNNPEDPQPKKKQRSGENPVHSTSTHPVSLPIIAEVPFDGFNSEDSNECEEEATSAAHTTHVAAAANANPVTITAPMPADRPKLYNQFHSPQIRKLFQKALQPILPFEFFNPQNLIETPLIRRSDLGQITKTKN
jgi:hypothetical protein